MKSKIRAISKVYELPRSQKSKLDLTHEQKMQNRSQERERERERFELERRDGIGEEIDPGDLSRSSLSRIIRRESIRNGASPVV